jgi:hypothetical protein
MQRKCLLIFITCLPALVVLGQNKTKKPSPLEFQLKPSVGYNIGLTKVLNGAASDHLIEYDDRSFYWQVLSLSLFFHKHWGIEFNYQAASSGKIIHNSDRFMERMQAEYNDNYFVTPLSGGSYDNFSIIGGDIERGYLGLIYRMESNRFFIYPKLAVGVTSFATDYGRTYLKERKSNKVVEVDYLPGKRPKDHLTLGASTAIGYKLLKWLYFNVDIQTCYYKTNFTYTKTTTDLESGQNVKESINYKKNVFNLGLGAGFIISLK